MTELAPPPKTPRKIKPWWMNRAVVYGLRIALCTNEAMFDAEILRMTSRKNMDKWCKPGKACIHTLAPKGGGQPSQIVCIDAAALLDQPTLAAAMLAHEATHAKQALMKVMGEKKPSDEFEAYVVQNIVHNLLDEYHRQVYGGAA